MANHKTKFGHEQEPLCSFQEFVLEQPSLFTGWLKGLVRKTVVGVPEYRKMFHGAQIALRRKIREHWIQE